jgi:hypothetical protein
LIKDHSAMTTPDSADGARAVATAVAVQMSAALVHMSAFVRQLRCGQPVRRSAFRVTRQLKALADCHELAPPLRSEFANLADIWSDWAVEPRPTLRPQALTIGARPRLRLIAADGAAPEAQPR